MTIMTTKITFKLLFLGFLFVAVASLAAVAYANHSWGNYHWDLSTADTTSNPLDIGDNLSTTAWNSSLMGASVDWNNSVLINEVVAGASNSNCDPTLGRVEVCNGEYGDNGWLGIAQIWTYRGKNRDHIAQGVVKVNDTYFNRPAYDTQAWRNFVMCQEVGHTFGLAHQDETFDDQNLGSCMDYTDDPDGTIKNQLDNQHPNQHDFDELAEIYAHLNGTSGGGGGDDGDGSDGGKPDKCDPWPSCKKNGDLPSAVTQNGPAQWGTAVAQDALGRNSRFVRNSNGYEITTHVLWTLEAEESDIHAGH